LGVHGDISSLGLPDTGTLPRRDIAKRLGRTDSALAYKAHTLRIPLEQKNWRPRGPRAGTRKPAPHPNPNAWTTAEQRFLRQHADHGTLHLGPSGCV
jgi:hypothetical protein